MTSHESLSENGRFPIRNAAAFLKLGRKRAENMAQLQSTLWLQENITRIRHGNGVMRKKTRNRRFSPETNRGSKIWKDGCLHTIDLPGIGPHKFR